MSEAAVSKPRTMDRQKLKDIARQPDTQIKKLINSRSSECSSPNARVRAPAILNPRPAPAQITSHLCGNSGSRARNRP